VGREGRFGIALLALLAAWALSSALLSPRQSSAALLLQFSATASSSAPSVSTNYVIGATTTNTMTSGQRMVLSFDPISLAFDLSTLAIADINASGFTEVGSCTGGPTNEMIVTIGADAITFEVCGGGDSVPPGPIVITLMNNKVQNPAAIGSYIIRLAGGSPPIADSGDTRVAIVDRVTMTASVDTNMTFTINGVASSTIINGDTTSTTTIPSTTAISFGTLSVGTSSIAGQRLNVSTNAVNGFRVTVTQNQNLTSNSGADIDSFQNGAPAYPPVAWSAPTGAIGNEQTYGHFGVTSDDATLPDGDSYGTSLYAGLVSTSTRTVMYNAGPSDGVTSGIGEVLVAYRLQITALQEAASDYTNQLTYVATPSF
jgi:hypothetical protein